MIKKIEQVNRNIKLSNIEGVYNSYRVPISELKFNPYNDRFAMETLEWENDNKRKLSFDEESQEFIFNLLSQNSKRNKATKDDILENGVLKNIVVNKEGIILDGNRRISILKTILTDEKKIKSLNKNQQKDFSTPVVVVIEKELNENEIRDYETSLQISEDEKVEYDPINIYLKIDRLFYNSFQPTESGKIKDVSKKMGASYSDNDIKKRMDTFRTMKNYLNFLGKDNQYTLLKKKEDQLKNISMFEKSFLNNSSIKFEKNKKMSEEEYRKILEVLFLMTAAQVEGKQFRTYVPGTKQKGKTPLQSSKGIKKVHEAITNNLASFRHSPVFNSDKKLDEDVKKIFKEAEIIVNMENVTFKIEQSFEKVNKKSCEILEWSENLIGKQNISKKYIKKLKLTIENLEKAINKIKDKNDSIV